MLLKLCIPCTDNKYSLQYIQNVISKTKIGIIKNIKEYPSQSKTNSKKVFIHMDVFDEELQNKPYIDRLTQGQNIKVMYEEPQYWKVLLCK